MDTKISQRDFSKGLLRFIALAGIIIAYNNNVPMLSLAKHIDSVFLRFWIVYQLASMVACIQAKIVLKLTGSTPDSKWKRDLRIVLIG